MWLTLLCTKGFVDWWMVAAAAAADVRVAVASPSWPSPFAAHWSVRGTENTLRRSELQRRDWSKESGIMRDRENERANMREG